MDHRTDVAVVGGGLAGLSAALRLARGGRRVTLFEKSGEPGGRGRTRLQEGFHLNLGPHALYFGGAGRRFLRELGLRPEGGEPASVGSLAYRGGELYLLPANLSTLVRTRLLSSGGKWELAMFLARLPRLDLEELAGVSVAAWLEDAFTRDETRDLVRAVLRIATYSNDPERQSAGAALGQLKVAQDGGVRYLHGGWQEIVDGLAAAARSEGVLILSNAPVEAVETGRRIEGVRLADGTFCHAGSVVLAIDPQAADRLLGQRVDSLARFARSAVPVRLATLDLGLHRLPDPRHLVAFGIDRPFYFSVHSAVARLAPGEASLVHVAQYLGSEPPADPASIEAGLVAFADRVQPGWRDALVFRRFLPDLRVSHHVVTAQGGGRAGRPESVVREIPGLHVAGDWVGPEGMLADAALASARAAALAILERVPAAGVA